MKHPFSTALALIALVSTPALAADSTWTSTVSQSWATSGNWSAGLPGANVGAIFADGSVQHTVDISSGQFTTMGFSFSFFAGGSAFDIIESGVGNGFNLRGGGTPNGILNNDDNTELFEAPIALFSANGFTGGGASQTFNAAAGGLTFSGRYANGSLPTINNNAGTITVTGGFNTTIGTTGRGDIVGGGGLIKNGAGTLTLGGTNANTYSGNTVLNQGVLTVAKNGAIGGALVFNGGILNLGGLNQNIGTPSLTGNSTLDFTGNSLPGHLLLPPGSNTVSFPDSHSVAWTAGTTLSILDWNANEKLRFGASSSALTAAQLSEIVFADQPGSPTAQIDPNGYVTPAPVPEPSTAALGLLGGCALAVSFVARRRKV